MTLLIYSLKCFKVFVISTTWRNKVIVTMKFRLRNSNSVWGVAAPAAHRSHGVAGFSCWANFLKCAHSKKKKKIQLQIWPLGQNIASWGKIGTVKKTHMETLCDSNLAVTDNWYSLTNTQSTSRQGSLEVKGIVFIKVNIDLLYWQTNINITLHLAFKMLYSITIYRIYKKNAIPFHPVILCQDIMIQNCLINLHSTGLQCAKYADWASMLWRPIRVVHYCRAPLNMGAVWKKKVALSWAHTAKRDSALNQCMESPEGHNKR